MAKTATTDRNLPLNRIRNIGIIAHIDAGKTTTTERILFYTGKTYKIGDIDEGSTQMDWMEQEKERGITIVSAATTAFWTPTRNSPQGQEAHRINIIDTPGHVDFTAEVERSLRVLDGGITVLDSEEGVQSQSETVWRQADKYSVPRICFANKMDKLGADFFATVNDVKEKLGANPAIMALPIGSESSFKGIVLLLEEVALVWAGDETGAMYTEQPIPQDMKAQVQEYRQKLIEQIAETNDVLLEKYLNNQTPSVDESKQALRLATISYKLVPIFCGSSLRNKGVQPLLDAVVEYLPSPLDVPSVRGLDIKDLDQAEAVPSLERKADDNEPFSALVFKIATDPYVGKLAFFRVYSGIVKRGTYVLNSAKGEKERVSRIVRMHANHREEAEEIPAGDLGALVGLKNTTTGDTLCDEQHPIVLERITFPEPV